MNGGSDRPDCVVIGGGPAGSTAATLLARAGWDVILFEREQFPREHVGESLLPASMPLLQQLGVLPDIEAAGFLKKWGATMVWGRDSEPWSWHFRETNIEYPHSFQVWRADFDDLLLRNAARQGAQVHEGQRVTAVSFEERTATSLRVADAGGEERTLSPRFVVDASGRAGLIARELRLRRNDEHFRNLAAYAYFEGASRLPDPDSNNIFIESYPGGWLWNIPLHTGRMSVGAVVDSTAGQEAIARTGADEFLSHQIREAPHTAAMLTGASRVSPTAVVRDWSYVSDEVSGPGWAIAGDAACFIDPLFSTGVHLALSSGALAAALATTHLRDPELARAAVPVYENLYLEQYSHFRELAKLFYASNRSTDSYFWEVRRALKDDSLTPREAFVRATAGQTTRGYERVVLEHGDLPPDFVAAVTAIERDQTGRAETMNQAVASRRILRARPALAPGVKIERRPVLAGDQFSWGQVLVSPQRPTGVEVSPLVGRLTELCDGRRTVAEIVKALAGGDDAERVLASSLTTIQILFTDSMLDLDLDRAGGAEQP